MKTKAWESALEIRQLLFTGPAGRLNVRTAARQIDSPTEGIDLLAGTGEVRPAGGQ
jgi:hypothetical protein